MVTLARVTVCMLVALAVMVPGRPGRTADGIQSIGSCQTVDKPGSYVLAKNLQAQGDCLVITTSFVTLDLAGYTISGSGTGAGIRGDDQNNLTIRNGSITNFFDGISLVGGAGGHIVEQIRATGNARHGIYSSSTESSRHQPATPACETTSRVETSARESQQASPAFQGAESRAATPSSGTSRTLMEPTASK